MINKLKLWFSRNDFNILIFIIVLAVVYFFIKGIGRYYGETLTNNKNIINNNESNKIVITENIEKIDRDSNQGIEVISIVEKFIAILYQANIVQDSSSLRQDIYNMFSKDTIQKFLNTGNIVNKDTILNFAFYVDNISNYSIGNIYKYKEENNIVRYAVLLRHKISENNIIDNYFIVYIDKNNSTFAYGGTYSNLSDIDNSVELQSIDVNESNKLED